MNEWYLQNLEHPYPNDLQKKEMADKGGITVGQVTFCRNLDRDVWTEGNKLV